VFPGNGVSAKFNALGWLAAELAENHDFAGGWGGASGDSPSPPL
jgi:hypothetical protein